MNQRSSDLSSLVTLINSINQRYRIRFTTTMKTQVKIDNQINKQLILKKQSIRKTKSRLTCLQEEIERGAWAIKCLRVIARSIVLRVAVYSGFWSRRKHIHHQTWPTIFSLSFQCVYYINQVKRFTFANIFLLLRSMFKRLLR